MLCDLCNKNQATVHLTEIVDDQMSELHLCEECARKKSVQMEQQFGLADLLAGLAEFGKPEETKEAEDLKCANCGLSYKDFKRIGRLGCGECYANFRKYLLPLLKKIHGSTQHVGKFPYKVAVKSKKKFSLAELRMKLHNAIEKEEFEEAAQLRDKIRELEKNGHK
ncbi:MAG: UvrB/UvrC motif-containing protein [Candidatus Omnitrophota bacterium]|jgi:protein arginine kinase activator